LVWLRGQLFRDTENAQLYCPDNGRVSMALSLRATALPLQTHDKAREAEAQTGADLNIRRRGPLGTEIEDR